MTLDQAPSGLSFITRVKISLSIIGQLELSCSTEPGALANSAQREYSLPDMLPSPRAPAQWAWQVLSFNHSITFVGWGSNLGSVHSKQAFGHRAIAQAPVRCLNTLLSIRTTEELNKSETAFVFLIHFIEHLLETVNRNRQQERNKSTLLWLPPAGQGNCLSSVGEQGREGESSSADMNDCRPLRTLHTPSHRLCVLAGQAVAIFHKPGNWVGGL